MNEPRRNSKSDGKFVSAETEQKENSGNHHSERQKQ
jgi:hypothetical protein